MSSNSVKFNGLLLGCSSKSFLLFKINDGINENCSERQTVDKNTTIPIIIVIFLLISLTTRWIKLNEQSNANNIFIGDLRYFISCQDQTIKLSSWHVTGIKKAQNQNQLFANEKNHYLYRILSFMKYQIEKKTKTKISPYRLLITLSIGEFKRQVSCFPQ